MEHAPARPDRVCCLARRCAAQAEPDCPLAVCGSGPGSVLREFRGAGYSVDALDVADSSYSDDLKPALYDGAAMPYADHTYDVALLLTVLHHIEGPEAVLREAARVARRVIIIEDVYDSAWQRKYTKIADSITNLEFFGHPHSNQSDAEWRKTFSRLGLTLVHGSVHRLAAVFQQAVYVLE